MSEFDLRALLAALKESGVRFVVIGGVAVGERAFDPAGDAAVIRRGGNVTAMTRFGELDVVQPARGVPAYTQLVEDAVKSELLGVPVKVCSLSRLRQMKEAQGREQDRADLANLPEE